MVASLQISPPSLAKWLDSDEQARNVMLFELEVDELAEKSLRFDLNVIFKPIRVPRGNLPRADWYIGSTGAEIYLEAFGGIVGENHTKGKPLQVNYKSTETWERKSAFTLAPEINIKSTSASAKAKLGDIVFKANSERRFESSFTCEERVLAHIHMENSVRWNIDLPKGGKAVRDFLFGNLYLRAECAWHDGPCHGRVTVRPSDIRFFDEERHARPMGYLANLSMRFTLFRRGTKIENLNGLTIKFTDSQG